MTPEPIATSPASPAAPREPASASASASAQSRDDRLGLLALVALLIAGGAFLLWEARDVVFNNDDWTLLMDRRGHGLDVFLDPHNEHLIAAQVAIYKLLLQVFGATSYTPFLATAIALHLAVTALVYLYACRRVGPWAALVPATLVVVLGAAWNDLVWAFQMGYYGSVAAGVGALLALDRRSRAGDVAASVLLVVSLLFSSIGVGMVAGAAVDLLLRRREDGLRRLFAVLAAPVVLYGLWYLVYGEGSARAHNVTLIPSYVADAFAAGMASVTGLANSPAGVQLGMVRSDWGRPLAIMAIVLVVLAVRRGSFRLSPRWWALVAIPLVLWAAAALSFMPGREAEQSRYQYVSAVMILLIAAELLRGWRPRGLAAAAWLAAGTAAVTLSNVGMLHDTMKQWNGVQVAIEATIGGIEIARDHVPPDFAPAAAHPVVAGPYLSVVDAFGSPAPNADELAGYPESARATVDGIVAEAERLTPAGEPEGVTGRRCERLPVRDGTVELQAAPGTSVTVRRPAPGETIQVRRLADGYGLAPWPLSDAAPTLTLPRDRSDRPWTVRVASAREAVAVCRATLG